jgi:4-hydroxybenzoate polyprenyltransferase
VDQDYDRQTARCRNRPIARGAISTWQGHIYTAAIVALAFLCIDHLPYQCLADACVIFGLAAIYPFGKRFTHFAQVPLGATLSGAIVMAQHSVGVNPFSEDHVLPTWCLVASVILLVMFYDVVYARRDTADDLKSGVKGMAVLFRNRLKVLLLILVVGIAMSLFLAGKFVNMGQTFFYFSVAGTALSLISMVVIINTSSIAKHAGNFYILAIACLLSGFTAEFYHNYEHLFSL